MTHKSLITSAMEDSEEFEALYVTHVSSIRRFLFWRTRDMMLVDDLTSDVFEKAWRNWGTFDGRSAKAWLHTIARNTLIDYWRSKKTVSVSDTDEIPQTDSATDTGEVLDRAMAMAAVQRSLAKLPKNMRQIVELRFIEGLSSRDVAEKLHITEANVRVLQYRALRKLRGYIS